MIRGARKILYRVFCIICFVTGLYIVSELISSDRVNFTMLIILALLLLCILWAVLDWHLNTTIINSQEKELKMYQLYIQPMEELVKEIRHRQHEYDNHMNAILSMHLTIDNYEELVEKQSQYIRQARAESVGKFLPLLRISDKVLAGFLYSKIVNAPDNVTVDVSVNGLEIISGISEHTMIEIIGILVDNAFEATGQAGGNILISLSSLNDKLSFDIFNEFPPVSFEELSRFFETGYSTKDSGNIHRGIGLSQAKKLITRGNGDITVGQESMNGNNYIHFSVII